MNKTNKVVNALKEHSVTIVSSIFKPAHKKNRFSYIREWFIANYKWITSYPKSERKDLFDIYPEARDFIVPLEIQYSDWNLNPLEIYYICCIALVKKPKRIFEFGTYNGATTLELAKTCPQSEIYTIDLPQDKIGKNTFIIGSRFTDTEYEKQITQLAGNSAYFDFTPYFNSIDLVFIDAGHEYEDVRADTETALKLVKPGGVIIWDDTTNWPGVKRAVEELIPAGHKIIQIEKTKLSILQLP